MVYLASHSLQSGLIKFRQELQTVCNGQTLPHWTYLQLRNFLSNRKSKSLFSKAPAQFETLCINALEVRKNTSLTYAWLQASLSVQPVHFKSKWEKALRRKISDTQWKKACILAHKCSISTRLQETSYRLLTH